MNMYHSGVPVIDVRTAGEFGAGHIPGAQNIPLFSNDERKIIGTTYKQTGRNEAIKAALSMVGPQLSLFAENTSKYVQDNQLLVHCWRGGMRSSSVAWLLNLLGVEVFTLAKGYKNFRKYVLRSFELPYTLNILGGKTGSAKTLVIAELQKRGQQTVDLESLASHKGSAFGSMGQGTQPTQEQFENELALILRGFDPKQSIWVEDESRTIGGRMIPLDLWNNMRKSKVFFLDVGVRERIAYLCNQYASPDQRDLLKNSFYNIKKRLGDVRFKEAIEAVDRKDFRTACAIALEYYDRAYEYGLKKRDPDLVTRINIQAPEAEKVANILLEPAFAGESP